MVQAWNELEPQYSTGLSTGIFSVAEASVVSSTPVPDEVFPGLDILKENQDLASPFAEQLWSCLSPPAPIMGWMNLTKRGHVSQTLLSPCKRESVVHQLAVVAGAEAQADNGFFIYIYIINRMEAYRVSCSVFNFAALTDDSHLKARDVWEVEFVSLPLNTIQRFEQDSYVLTMVGSFLDCCRVTLTLDLPPRGG